MDQQPQLQPLEDQITAILRDLDSCLTSRHEAAEHSLRDMGLEIIEPLLVVCERELSWYRRFKTYSGNSGLCIFLFYVVNWLTSKGKPNIWAWVALGGFCIVCGGLIVCKIGERRCVWRLTQAMEILARFEDLRVIGPLLEGLEHAPEHTRPGLVEGLKKILPRLKASDSHLLNDEQRNSLHRTLQSSASHGHPDHFDADLTVIILRALIQVGEEGALPYVEKIVNYPWNTKWGARIREAAQECLSVLGERVERERPGRMLLRPAQAPDASAEVLLRPAQGVSEADPQVLLRPSTPPG